MNHILLFPLTLAIYAFSSHSVASGKVPAAEISALFSGKTVEGERRDGGKPGIDPPGTINNFPTQFTMYFGSDGALKRVSTEKQKIGKWRASADGGLCMEWEGKKEKCAPVYKQGNVYKRTVNRRNGSILFEHTYINFTLGGLPE